MHVKRHSICMGSTLLLALLVAWNLGCGEDTPPATAPSSSDPSPNKTATASDVAESANDLRSLPAAIRILAPEYHAAYRLLPDGPQAQKHIDVEFADFDYEEWHRLEWDDGGAGTTFEFDVAGVLPILQDAAGSEEDRRWIAERIRNLDPEAASQFMAAENIFGLAEVLRVLVDEQGLYLEVKEIKLRFDGMKARHPEEFINLTIEDAHDTYEYFMALGERGLKEQIVLRHEVSVCTLLMDIVVGEHPRLVITDGRCDIAKAVELAERKLANNGGRPARDEESFQ